MNNFSKEQKLIIDMVLNIYNIYSFKVNKSLLDGLDWQQLLKLSLQHKVFIPLYKHIKNDIPDRYRAQYEQKYNSFVMMNNIILNELERIIKITRQNNINVVLVKGFALSQIIYNDLNSRQFNDIDLLVSEKDMKKTYYLLSDLGFAQYTGYDVKEKKINTIDKPILLYGSNFHEFKCIKLLEDGFCLSIEIKKTTSAIPFQYINDFFTNVEEIYIINFYINTINLDYTLIHLIANSYESYEPPEYLTVIKSNIRDLYEPYIFIKKYGNEIDWIKLSILSNKYMITHKFFYMLNLLSGIYGNFISPEIIDLFNIPKITYDYKGNIDGSIYSWESNFFYRLFNDEERNAEFARVKKALIYRSNNHYEEDVKTESLSILSDYGNYTSFNLGNQEIKYMFTYNKNSLYLNLIASNVVLNKLDKYYIVVSFLDNKTTLYRYIIIEKTKDSSNLYIQFINLDNCSHQSINIGDECLIRVFIPVNSLQIDFKESNNRLLFNVTLREKVGCDAFRIIYDRQYITKKYSFLKFPQFIT